MGRLGRIFERFRKTSPKLTACSTPNLSTLSPKNLKIKINMNARFNPGEETIEWQREQQQREQQQRKQHQQYQQQREVGENTTTGNAFTNNTTMCQSPNGGG